MVGKSLKIKKRQKSSFHNVISGVFAVDSLT